MEEIILFLGSIRTGEYEYILDQGLNVGALIDSNATSVFQDREKLVWIESVDFSSKNKFELLYQAIDRLKNKFTVSVIFNTRESYIYEHCKLSEYLRLPTMSEDVIESLSNKTLMKSIFVDKLGQDSTAQYAEIKSVDQLDIFVKNAQFPIILKPMDLAASMFVRKVHSREDLYTEYENIVCGIKKYYKKNKSSEVTDISIQVEQFLEGSVHSIDIIVSHNSEAWVTPIVDVKTGHDIGFEDFHHFVRRAPTILSPEQKNIAYNLALNAIQALRMHSCIAHVEFIQTIDGPKLLEIAGRPGAHRNRLIEKSYGFSLHQEFINLSFGKVPEIPKQEKYNCAIITPFPKQHKIFHKTSAIEESKHLLSFSGLNLRADEGSEIGPASRGYYSSFSIELISNKRKQIDKDIETIEKTNYF